MNRLLLFGILSSLTIFDLAAAHSLGNFRKICEFPRCEVTQQVSYVPRERKYLCRYHARHASWKNSARYYWSRRISKKISRGKSNKISFSRILAGLALSASWIVATIAWLRKKFLKKQTPEDTIKPNSNSSLPPSGNNWYQEGLLFCYGHQGHPVDYEKAEECFKKAIAAGEEKGQSGLEYLKYLR